MAGLGAVSVGSVLPIHEANGYAKAFPDPNSHASNDGTAMHLPIQKAINLALFIATMINNGDLSQNQ